MSRTFGAYTDRPHYLYRLLNESGALLYVGISNDIKNRMSAHARTQHWWAEVSSTEVEPTPYPDRRSALDAERRAIATEDPRYNVHLVGASPERPEYRGLGVEDLQRAAEALDALAAAKAESDNAKERLREATLVAKATRGVTVKHVAEVLGTTRRNVYKRLAQ